MPNCMLGFIVKHFWHLFSVWQDFPKPSGECQLKIKFWWLWWNLKLNLLVADLSWQFGVSDSFVSKTVKFWIDTLAIHLTNLIVWLPREIIKATMPSCLERYPNTTRILDGAETKLATWSQSFHWAFAHPVTFTSNWPITHRMYAFSHYHRHMLSYYYTKKTKKKANECTWGHTHTYTHTLHIKWHTHTYTHTHTHTLHIKWHTHTYTHTHTHYT